MASPAQLVQAISDATGVPHPTLVDIDRRLAKGGLRSMGGRGLNAARVTALDAARLLTALLGSAQANMSVEAVERYQRTQMVGAAPDRPSRGWAELGDLAALPATHSFVAMLEAVIIAAMTGSIARLNQKASPPHIEIYAFTRATRGTVRLSGLPSEMTAVAEYAALPAGRGRKRRPTADDPGDLEQSRRITERTIFPLAELLAETDRHD